MTQIAAYFHLQFAKQMSVKKRQCFPRENENADVASLDDATHPVELAEQNSSKVKY